MRNPRLAKASRSATPTPFRPAGAGIHSGRVMTRARLSRVMTPRRIRRRHKLRSAEMAEQVQTQEGGLRERVEQVLDTIRPYIQGDGGDIELLDVNDGGVQIRLDGEEGGRSPATMSL